MLDEATAVTHRVLPVPASATRMLHDLTAHLRGCGVRERCVVDAGHVVYELVMNGVDHGTPDDDGLIDVAWAVEPGDVRITVRDSGTPDDGQVIERLTPTPDQARGRGLAMVEAFSSRWTSHRNGGTVVTAWVATLAG